MDTQTDETPFKNQHEEYMAVMNECIERLDHIEHLLEQKFGPKPAPISPQDYDYETE